MLCNALAALTRQYIDEPTQDYVTNSQLAGWLDQAYREFRAIVSQKDQNFLSREHTVAITGTYVDLKGILLPPNPTQPQMQRLTRVLQYQTGVNNSQYPVIMQPVSSLEGLKSAVNGGWTASYFMDRGTGRLWVNGNLNGVPLTIQYIPEPTITWTTAIAPNSTVALEDGLDDWHELVAFLAARRYFIRDGVANKVIDGMIKESKSTLYSYLGKNTSNAGGYIRHESSTPW